MTFWVLTVLPTMQKNLGLVRIQRLIYLADLLDLYLLRSGKNAVIMKNGWAEIQWQFQSGRAILWLLRYNLQI